MPKKPTKAKKKGTEHAKFKSQRGIRKSRVFVHAKTATATILRTNCPALSGASRHILFFLFFYWSFVPFMSFVSFVSFLSFCLVLSLILPILPVVCVPLVLCLSGTWNLLLGRPQQSHSLHYRLLGRAASISFYCFLSLLIIFCHGLITSRPLLFVHNSLVPSLRHQRV